MKKILLLFFVFLLFSSAYVEAKDDALKKIRPRHVVNAIIEGDLTKLQNYIDKGVDINGAYFGSQFISYAISTHQDDVLDFLLENGADPNPENEMSLLYYAIMEKNQYALARLLKAGADPNKTFMGDTPKNLARTHKNKIFIEIYENYEQNPDTFMPNKYKEKVFIATKAPKKQEITKNQINGETKSISTDKIQNADLKQIQEDRYDFDIKAIFSVEKKDPKLITITKTKPVNNKIYSTKVANDGLIYKKNKNQLSEEYYNLYVILDKLLRANNLQYQNWRVGIALNPEEINATASAANFITINSSLYDSFYQNKDALSFVIAHELSHLVLGHAQKTLENRLRIAELERQILQATNEAEAQRTLGNINAALGNSYASIGNSVASLANSVSASMLESDN